MKNWFFLFILFASIRVSGQDLIFCEGVNKMVGEAVNPSSYFTIKPNGGVINLLIKLPTALSSRYVLIDIYHIDRETKKELFDNSIHYNTEPSWLWFSKEITFYKNGEYVVYVYDERDQLLCAGKVRIAIQ